MLLKTAVLTDDLYSIVPLQHAILIVCNTCVLPGIADLKVTQAKESPLQSRLQKQSPRHRFMVMSIMQCFEALGLQ
jgi:hypothetical protein